MKKLVYTLSFITVLGFMGHAQTKEMKQDPNKQDPSKGTEARPAGAKPENHEGEPKSRMAITQKGVPASKTKDNNKEMKPVEPSKGQPTQTEKH